MRRPLTFLLTLLLDEQDLTLFRGRIRAIATEREAFFARLEELLEFVRAETTGKTYPAEDSDSTLKEEK